MRRLLRTLLGVDVAFAELEHRLARRELREAEARVQLLGPIHGTAQTIRGMCSDELTYEEIDGKVAELDDLIYEVATILGHPLC